MSLVTSSSNSASTPVTYSPSAILNKIDLYFQQTHFLCLKVLKEYHSALLNNLHVDLKSYKDQQQLCSVITELEKDSDKLNTSEKRLLLAKIENKVAELAEKLFKQDKSFYESRITEAIKHFPLRNETDIAALSFILKAIQAMKDRTSDINLDMIIGDLDPKVKAALTEALATLSIDKTDASMMCLAMQGKADIDLTSVKSIKKFLEEHSPKWDNEIKKGIKDLIDLYNDDPSSLGTEMHCLFRERFKQIAGENVKSLTDQPQKALAEYSAREKKSEDSKALMRKATTALKREVKEPPKKEDDPLPATSALKIKFPEYNQGRIEEIQAIYRYLNQLGVEYKTIAKVDNEVMKLFLNGFGKLEKTKAGDIIGNGPLGDMIFRNMKFEAIVMLDENGQHTDIIKTKLLLANAHQLLTLWQNVDFPHTMLTQMPIAKLELLLRHANILKELKKRKSLDREERPLSLKFLSVLPTTLLGKYLREPDKISMAILCPNDVASNEVASTFAFLRRLDAKVYKDRESFLDGFEQLSDDKKEYLLTARILSRVTGLVELGISWPIIYDSLNSKIDFVFTLYSDFVKMAIKAKVSSDFLFTFLKEKKGKSSKACLLLVNPPETVEKLLKLVDSRLTPDQRLQHVLDLDEEGDLTKVLDNIDLAVRFVGTNVELKKLADAEVFFWEEFKEIVEHSANIVTVINNTNVDVLLTHTYEINLFLKSGMPVEALSTQSSEQWTILASKSAQVLSYLEKKPIDWPAIVTTCTTPRISKDKRKLEVRKPIETSLKDSSKNKRIFEERKPVESSLKESSSTTGKNKRKLEDQEE